MNLSNQNLRLLFIGIGIALFLYAAGAFLIRLIIALIGIALILFGLSNGKSFFMLKRFKR